MSKSRKHNIDVNKLIDRAADQEQKFLSSRFIAPALSGGVVRVKIGEAVCRIKTAPEDFEGY